MTVEVSKSSGSVADTADGSDDDSGEEGDEDHEIEAPKTPSRQSMAARSRRPSVSAESIDPTQSSHRLSLIATVPKSPEVTAELLQVLSKSPLLCTLDKSQKDLIVKSFNGPVHKPAGENIIVRGDIGDVFYLLERGEVDVYVQNKAVEGGDDIKVHTYTDGNSFGELAIMYNAPRAATCRARTDCVLWTLDRVAFKAIVVSATMQRRATHETFLREVPTFKSLTEMEVLTLADVLKEETYVSGEVICRQGDAGDYFYIVKSGGAVCTIKDAESGQETVVAKLTTGNYFGEIALLTTKPRQATVTAQGELVVLSIDRATFTRVFGSLDGILERNMVQYSATGDGGEGLEGEAGEDAEQ